MASGFVFGILIKKYQNLLLAAAACVIVVIALYVLLSEPESQAHAAHLAFMLYRVLFSWHNAFRTERSAHCSV